MSKQMKKIEIHQIGFAKVIAKFEANRKEAEICLRHLNADLLTYDQVLVTADNLLNRDFYYIACKENGEKKLVVDLAGPRIANDTEFIRCIYERDRRKHVDYNFEIKFGRAK